MKKKINHIAIIPARKNSKGLKLKNRLLFDYTEKFLLDGCLIEIMERDYSGNN